MDGMRHQYPLMRQAANGYWYIWYGRLKRESLKTRDKRIAAQVFARKKQERRDQKLLALRPKAERRLAEFITEYTTWRADERKSAATVDMDGLALRLLLEHAGNKSMSLIRPKDVDMFHAWLMQPKKITTPAKREKTKGGCARTTVNVYIRHLKVAFKRALRWGYIIENPYADVKQYSEDRKEPPFLTEREIKETLLPAIKPKDRDFKLMIEVYLYTGCRGAEVCRMQRRDFVMDGETGRLFVVIPKTKTHRARRIPVPAAMLPILDELPALGYLFPRWRNVQTVSKKLKRYLRSVGLSHMYLHGLRHTTTSHLTMKGVPDKAKMQMLGHTQASTLKRYEHLSPDYLIEIADKLSFEERAPAVSLVRKKRGTE
jgi:integrase